MRQLVDRIGAILGLYTFGRGEWGVTELGRELGLAKSTVSEIVASLVEQGLLERTPRGRFRLGWRVFSLNQVLLESAPLVRESRPVMQELVERYGESSHLMVLERDQAVIVEKVQATLATQIMLSRIGARLPAHCSACGKLLLAALPEGELERLFGDAELQTFTAATLTDPGALRAELATIRTSGVAFDREEIVPGLSCLAAPIRDEAGKVVAGLSLSMPTYRFQENAARFEQVIRTAGERVSRRLGHAPRPLTAAA